MGLVMVCAIVLYIGLSQYVLTCSSDLSNRDSLTSERPHDVRHEDGDIFATNTRPDVPGFMARPTRGWPEVHIQRTHFLYLGCVIHESAYLLFEIARLVPLL